jgi:LysM repeat protein
MSVKQWVVVTFVVILNIVIFGVLLSKEPQASSAVAPAAWTPYPTYTPKPRPTVTAIVMPTEPVPPTETAAPTATPTPLPVPQVHVVQEGETLDGIADWYGTTAFTLRLLNRLPEGGLVQPGQELTIPVMP